MLKLGKKKLIRTHTSNKKNRKITGIERIFAILGLNISIVLSIKIALLKYYNMLCLSSTISFEVFINSFV